MILQIFNGRGRGIHPKKDDLIIFPMDPQNYCLFVTLNYFKPHIEIIGYHKDDLISLPKASGALYPRVSTYGNRRQGAQLIVVRSL